MSYVSPMSRALVALKAKLAAWTTGTGEDEQPALKGVQITPVEISCPAYPYALISSGMSYGPAGDSTATLDVVLYVKGAVCEDLLLEAWDFAEQCKQYLRKHLGRLLPDVDTVTISETDHGGKWDPDAKGDDRPAILWITLSIKPQWLEDL